MCCGINVVDLIHFLNFNLRGFITIPSRNKLPGGYTAKIQNTRYRVAQIWSEKCTFPCGVPGGYPTTNLWTYKTIQLSSKLLCVKMCVLSEVLILPRLQRACIGTLTRWRICGEMQKKYPTYHIQKINSKFYRRQEGCWCAYNTPTYSFL